MIERIMHAGFSLLLLLSVAVLFSHDRRAIRLRTVLPALVLQVAIGALVLFVPAGREALRFVSRGVEAVLGYGDEGVAFLFGALVDPKMIEVFGGLGFILALKVLPQIIYVSALIALLYHFGVMQALTRWIGEGLRRCLGTSRVESFAAVATIFVGQSEIALALRPFLPALTRAELFAVMSGGMAAVAGSILAGYAALGVPVDYLLAASFMAIPGGLLYAKILLPTKEPSAVVSTRGVSFGERRSTNVFEAVAEGTQKGVLVAVAVGAMLIAFVGLVALLNGIVGKGGEWLGWPGLTMQGMLGQALAPLAWLLGVPWEKAGQIGAAIGEKLVLNEFLAYAHLSPSLRAGELDTRTVAIVSFALCGFANFASIGIQVAAFDALAPERRGEVASLGLRAVLAGTLSNLTSATIAGLFVA
jgi:CNT family concentrative nucleoside transporter